MNFADHLQAVAARRGARLSAPPHPEPLAALDYATEMAIKQAALAEFWQAQRLPRNPEPLVTAPEPRGYRTTTKRRVAPGARGPTLFLPGAAPGRSASAPAALDPPAHLAVYAFLANWLARPPARPLAAALNWVIVRGVAPRLAIILNVRVFDARLVRAAKQLAAALPQSALGVTAAFLYLDPTASDYYLETRRPDGQLAFKRLFGPAALEVAVDAVRLRFPATVFSQVNGPMLGTMVERARELLTPSGDEVLLDLYCGYGFFALTIGRDARRVVGVDYDGPAIEAARQNAEHLGVANRTRFVAGRIDTGFLVERVRPSAGAEVLLLDPPRQGTAPGVIAALAARRPRRVLHICCGADEIPREIAAWSAAGYRLQRAVPLDLFAGTTGLETFLLFGPNDRDA